MTEFRPRFFTSDAEIEHLGEGLLARTLEREEWTHEAHLAATTYLLLRRPDVDLVRELREILDEQVHQLRRGAVIIVGIGPGAARV